MAYYEKCRRASEPLQLADLLIEFEKNHPTEWWCSGWKSDVIADLVIGYGDTGKDGKNAAEHWFSEHWKISPANRRDTPTAKQVQALWAARSLSALPREQYEGYFAYVKWLGKNWDHLTARGRKDQALWVKAASQYLAARPRQKVIQRDLIELTAAYWRCREMPGRKPAGSKVHAKWLKTHNELMWLS